MGGVGEQSILKVIQKKWPDSHHLLWYILITTDV